MAGLKVVALVSGGKDSFFSILHCIANGHDVVALANLYPLGHDGRAAAEDTDSFMYQTIGHAIIPLYEEALGLPLFRQGILGSAVNSSKDYEFAAHGKSDANGDDETESLVPLLKKVMIAHPEVNAVSTGAILSDYQRTRVESVALRLGLTPLSYLWQYPGLPPNIQHSLLDDMRAAGQDSRIIKVASGGLDDGFLWQNVADTRTIHRIKTATERFGSAGDGAVLGEGGEYETLAVDGPAPLWKRRIDVPAKDWQAVAGEAGTAFARITNAECVEKVDTDAATTLRRPTLLDSGFAALFENHQDDVAVELPREARKPLKLTSYPRSESTGGSSVENATLLAGVTGQGKTAAEQTESIMERILEHLSKASLGCDDICYTSIILRHMADFSAVNPVYGRYFKAPKPPARVTISCGDVLPEGSLLSISVTSVPRPQGGQRLGLHVQSRSYWAPANIGPYSQAIATPLTTGATGQSPNMVYVAGQIPLVPASMELPGPNQISNANDGLLTQAILSLQHLHRIGVVMQVRVWLHTIAFLTASSHDEASSQAAQARRLWQTYATKSEVEEDDDDVSTDFDVWNTRHGLQSHTHGHDTGNQDNAHRPCPAVDCTLSIIVVDELPRGASIEWASYGSTGEADNVSLPHFESLLATFAGRILL